MRVCAMLFQDIRKFFTPTSSSAKKPSNEEPKKNVAAPTKGKSKQPKAAKEPKQTKPAKEKETKKSLARNPKSSKNEEEKVAPKVVRGFPSDFLQRSC
ncbi:hypothetical protein HPB47_004951 [Ixodes persulcatus]|uniref:Uncharacterized protein n=1 Tax=Ixodes persulcatus TaxID=34615 RepID=A0AC60PEC0_IXOPE|nr:hypothetical protein HPB47_004951 [Ixodes persulcatus]